jgi:hypothetical protein
LLCAIDSSSPVMTEWQQQHAAGPGCTAALAGPGCTAALAGPGCTAALAVLPPWMVLAVLFVGFTAAVGAAFAAAQAEYEAEGIDWSYIDFVDNQDVLDLIEGRLGLVDQLDETCRFPTATPRVSGRGSQPPPGGGEGGRDDVPDPGGGGGSALCYV